MINFIALFILSFALSFFLILFLKWIILKFKLLNKDNKPPFIGGVCFFLPFFLLFLSFNYINKQTLPFEFVIILVFSAIVFLLEILDDIKDFSLRTRLIIQFFFISCYLLYGKSIQIYYLPQWLNYLLSFLWIMGITNAFNLLDIADGVCGGVSVIICLSFMSVSLIQNEVVLASLFISILGALLAFLFFNLPKAKVFMGNSGSHFLGFLFAAFSAYGDYATAFKPWSLILPLLILGFPIIDTFFLIVSRLKNGISPLRKSNDHIFLRLISSGLSHKRSLMIIYLISLLWALCGILILFGVNLYFFTLIIISIWVTLRIIGKAFSAG